ncbi:hypothetical protein PQX77_013556 [Marasmius sp. AFHP31]|nr:hypothetical protein PQX77_013556 [Marasmius sp. AFHP31]
MPSDAIVSFPVPSIAVTAASAPPAVVERDVVSGRVRMMMWFRKSPNMTFQEFSDHWRTSHAKLFLNTTAVKRNMLKYEQLHVNQEWKQKFADEGYNVPDYDGIMVAEAATMDKILECFSNDEYNDTILPDSFTFSDVTSAVYGAFDIAHSIDKEPNPPAYGVIRTDTKRVVVDFSHKKGMSYTDFTNYFRNTEPAKINTLISSGVGKDVTLYEQLTLSSLSQSTVSNPFTAMTGWDAVAEVAASGFQYLLDTSKNSQFISLMKQDAPNFVNTAAGFQVIPVDVVSFEIPK